MFKVLRRTRAIRNSSLEVRYDRWCESEAERETRLEGIVFTDVTDLGNVCLDDLESVVFDVAIPRFELIFYASSCCTNPLELKVEYCGRVVDDIMVENNRFCLVTFLERWLSK